MALLCKEIFVTREYFFETSTFSGYETNIAERELALAAALFGAIKIRLD